MNSLFLHVKFGSDAFTIYVKVYWRLGTRCINKIFNVNTVRTTLNGPFTPAIFSTIAWTWTSRWVMGDTVLYGHIYTCDLVNYCMDWKVQ